MILFLIVFFYCIAKVIKNLNLDGSCIEFSDRIETKKAKMNLVDDDDDDKSFQSPFILIKEIFISSERLEEFQLNIQKRCDL